MDILKEIVIDQKRSFKKALRLRTKVPKLLQDQSFRSFGSDPYDLFEKKL